MTSTPSAGRLTLSWVGKDRSLLGTAAGGYEWVERYDPRVTEVRLLHERETVGDAAPGPNAADNLLVVGDAYDALHALTHIPEYADNLLGQIKLIYIDPPFNTGQAFAQYDDALEHSIWLTMMRDRLLFIRDLLAPDGSVWVHLDDAEMAYCRVLMDEVFGRGNFIANVVWQKIHARNNSAQHFSAVQDYLLVYALDRSRLKLGRVERTELSDSDFWNPDDDPRGRWRRSDLTASHAYEDGRYEVTGPHGDVFTPPRRGATAGGRCRGRPSSSSARTTGCGGARRGGPSPSVSGSSPSWAVSCPSRCGPTTRSATTARRRARSPACSTVR